MTNLHIKEIQPIAFFVAIAISTLFFERLLKGFLTNKLKEKLLVDAGVLTLLSLVLFWAGWELSYLYDKWSLRETLKNLAILTSAFYITRASHLILGKRGVLKFLPYTFFSISFILSILFIYMPFEDQRLLWWILVLKKLFIYFGVLTLVWEQRLPKAFRLSSFLILSLIFALWALDYLKFNFKTLIGIAILVFITAIYTITYSKLLKKIIQKTLKELSERDVDVVIKNLKNLLTIFYLLVAVKVLELFSNLSKLIDKVKEVKLIQTDLINVSIGNLINFTLLAVILFSLLNIIKKLIKLSFPSQRREVEGGSAEALIFNLGVLINSIVLLSTLGITWKVILPIAGTLGVGLGFGLQTIMNNYVSGFILLFSKKLKVGDIVELPSISVLTLGSPQPSVFGKVEDIGILSTIVRTNDGVEISIPNSNFISSPIVNFSLKDPYVRIKVPVGVAYWSDPMKVKEILEEVIKELPYTVKFLPISVRFEELGDSALIFRALFWIDVRKNMWVKNVVSDFYYKVWYRFKEEGIEIPFPQNDIWFRNKLKIEVENFKGGEVDKSNS